MSRPTARNLVKGSDDIQSMREQILVNAPYAFPILPVGPNGIVNFEVLTINEERDGNKYRAVLVVTDADKKTLMVAMGNPEQYLIEAMRNLLRLVGRVLSEELEDWRSGTTRHRYGKVANAFVG